MMLSSSALTGISTELSTAKAYYYFSRQSPRDSQFLFPLTGTGTLNLPVS